MHSPSRFWLAAVTMFTLLFGPAAFAGTGAHKTWDYPPFGADDIALYQAFQASCSKFMAMKPTKRLHKNAIYGTAGQWQVICKEGLAHKAADLEDYLNTRLAKVKLNDNGKFTGYFKPVVQGSRTRHGAYQTPLLARPKDLARCHGATGQRHADGSCTTPYPTRHQIMTNLKAYKPIVWLDDPVDAYFLHIQGSGTVELEDGTPVHIGFAGKNGHRYVAIGRVLRDMGELTGTITADSIRKWLKDNPSRAAEVLHSNPSFIFFHESPTEAGGAFGVVLTAGRSMAVDKAYTPLGVPLFVQSTNTFDKQPWQRIMFAQDVGSAIKGPGRGDIYFGHGPLAGDRAGDQNAPGSMWALVPKENVGEQAVARADQPTEAEAVARK